MAAMEVVIAPRTGLRLRNPVIAASGTFGYGTEFGGDITLSGLAALVCKGTTREPRTGHAPLRMVETAAGMLNAIGLQNIGVEAVVREKAPQWARWSIPVLVNISGTCLDEYAALAAALDGVPGVSGIEINISCPNVEAGGVQFGVSPEPAAAVTRAVRAQTVLPLVVKLSPNVADIRSIAAAVVEAGADAVSVANTVYGMAIDSARRQPLLSNRSGGLSGPAIKPYALYLVYQVAQEVSVPVLGIGGIMTGKDALEFLMAGATAVEVGTALLIDPRRGRAIVEEMAEWCRREGVRDMKEIIGAANTGYKGQSGKR
jgi:dihydroorotate dehydrogenase (NAD+) catalytic subunit